MNVSREVVLDLLPLYVAGEASPASMALVEEWLLRDPELGARVRALRAGELAPAGGEVVPDLELATIRRTRGLIATLRWLLSLGLASLALALAMEARFAHGRLVEFHFVIRDFPWLGLPLAFGIACLIGYFVLRRRLRYSSR